MNFLKRLAALLPIRWQQQLRRWYYAHQIRTGKFSTAEAEYKILDSLVEEGDWVLDIGANIGHYANKFSALVGKSGRVIAFEPIPESFELLAANSLRFSHRNVTLLNVAVSDRSDTVNMEVPKWDSGLNNYYTAHIASGGSGTRVFCCPIDSLTFNNKISLVKIDTEGHELAALIGMQQLLERDQPHLIVEDNSPDVLEFLAQRGYDRRQLPGSRNFIFQKAGAGLPSQR